MSFPTRFQGSTALIAAALVMSPAVAMASEEEDPAPHVVIGDVGGQLTFGFEATEPDPITGALVIPITTFEDPIEFTGLTGFRNIPFDAVEDLAFEAPGADEMDELMEFGFDAAVPETSNIIVEAVSLPSDFSLFLLGQDLLDDAGDSLELGSPEFDVHPLYILETTDALTLGQTVTGTFRFVDTTGALSPSGTFDVTLEVVPEPGTATLAALAGSALLLRRRRAAA